MFVHSVYFWLKPDLSEEDRAKFWAGVRSLTTIESVRQDMSVRLRQRIAPVIDRSYSSALVVAFGRRRIMKYISGAPCTIAFANIINRVGTKC